MIRKFSFSFVFMLCAFSAASQNVRSWIVYSHQKFVHSLSLETNVPVYKQFGVHGGVGFYYQNYINDQVVNTHFDNQVGFFNANLDLSAIALQKCNHQFSVILGYSFYFGPDFQPLFHSSSQGYNIYFDASHYTPDFGFDFGISYSYKRFSGLFKFDTARNNSKFGLGYVFGNAPVKPEEDSEILE